MSKKRIPLNPERVAFLRSCPVMRVHDAQQIYQIGRNRIYSGLKSGELKFTKLGGSTLLHVASLEALVFRPVEAVE
jgi:hypothetical protein